jgi:hypothetical protein
MQTLPKGERRKRSLRMISFSQSEMNHEGNISQHLNSENPVNYRGRSASAIFARPTRRAARGGRLRPLRRRETGKDFFRLLPSTIGTGQRIPSLIHFLDLLKGLSTFSTLIFIDRHDFLPYLKMTCSMLVIRDRVLNF